MKYKIFFFLIILAAMSYFGCIQKQVREQIAEVKTQYASDEADRLTKFFQMCNSDIRKAVDIIAAHKMSGMLTHLKKMDMDGKKYYLLEREHLTEMIKSVNEGTYSDLILINNKGVIIYTMTNDDIFGKHVKYHLKDSALERCFDNSANGFYLTDVVRFPPDNGNAAIFAAFPDKTDDYIKGVFVIQINMEIIDALFEKKTVIIGSDGNYRLDKDLGNIFKPYKYLDKIDLVKAGNTGKGEFEIQNKKYHFYSFNYGTLSWIIIPEN
jgi:hypothetical protein